MATAWIDVINNGTGTPNVVRKSHAATTVVQEQPGVNLVTFPTGVRGLACSRRSTTASERSRPFRATARDSPRTRCPSRP